MAIRQYKSQGEGLSVELIVVILAGILVGVLSRCNNGASERCEARVCSQPGQTATLVRVRQFSYECVCVQVPQP